MVETTGQVLLRAEHFESLVKGFALQEFVMKQLVMVDSSSSWIETYYRETATELTGGTGSAVTGVPRLANFPYGEVSWSKIQAFQQKYGMEGVISWEDYLTNNIPVMARTLLRISRAVANAVDANIWNTLTENQVAVNIQTRAITSGNEWDSATLANQDPVKDFLQCIRLLQEKNFNFYNGNGYIVLNPKDYANVLANANVKNVAQFYTDAVTRNGQVGRMLGATILVSNAVTADNAAVLVGQECGTWKQLIPLTVESIQDPGICWKIRAYEIGVCQLTTPNAVVLITNTAA